MKIYLTYFWMLFGLAAVTAQPNPAYLQGSVTFVSSQHTYVKFASTETIQPGDTLFKDSTGVGYLPWLVVKNKSTVSCVAVVLAGQYRPAIGTYLYARAPKTLSVQKNNFQIPKPPVNANPEPVAFTAPKVDRAETEKTNRQEIRGRISAASYSNLAGAASLHQMRYSINLQGTNINNSRFSTDNYLTFRHTLGAWDEVRSNFNRSLIIYSLGVKYDIDTSASLFLGRRMNQHISSMGAIDGLQYAKQWGRWHSGVLVGSRPDFEDYGINLHLLQAGGYLNFSVDTGRITYQTTLAFVEQQNQFKTDRRFAYFQQTAALGNILSAFASLELDLFSTVGQRPHLTNSLVSIQVQPSRKVSVSAAYDNRKNVIYYESYKSFIDQLIENETRQGLRASLSYRPFKTISWGASSSWRFQKNQVNRSLNINTYLNFNTVPLLKASASITANLLQTDFLNSRMLGVRLSKELIPGVWFADLNGRYVDYAYSYYENKVQQYIGGADFSFTISKKWSLHTYYEGTFSNTTTPLHRLHTKIIRRF